VCSDDGAYDDDEGGDDIDTDESSGGSGYVNDRDMAPPPPPRRVHYNHRRYRPQQLPPVPVEPHFDTDRHYVDPSFRRSSTRRRPVMYTAASVAAGPVIYTTPGDVYFTPRRTHVSNGASLPSCVVSLVLVVTVSRLTVVCATLSAVL